MTAHLLIPALDEEHCSTLSTKTLHYLRQELGFVGLIFTDSLFMEGVLRQCQNSVDEAAIRAFKAGCDVLLLGGKQLVGGNALELNAKDVRRIHASIVSAVKSGRISEKRLNESVERILILKEKYLYSKDSSSKPVSLDAVINTKAHRALAQEIASRAIQVTKGSISDIAPLSGKRVAVFAPDILRDSFNETAFGITGSPAKTQFFSLHPSLEEIETALQAAEKADVSVVFSHNAWKCSSQSDLIRSLLDRGKRVVLIVTRDPLDGTLFPKADLIINTYSPTVPSIQAVSTMLN